VSGLNLATPDARHRRPLKFFIPSYGNGGTKSSKRCWNITDPPIIMAVRKAFFDVGHPLKYQSKNRRKLDGKFLAVYLRIDDV
jgi:hypothetical protein